MAQTRYSDRTLAELIRRVAAGYSHAELSVLLLSMSAQGVDEDKYGKVGNLLQRATRLIEFLSSRDDSDDAIQALAQELISDWGDRLFDYDGNPVASMQRLLESLRADGFEVVDGRLVATTPAPTSVAREMSALERELQRRGLATALRHYQQAVDSFTDARLEASNGQLRSFLENLLQQISEQQTGEQARDPRGAVERLRNAGLLDGDEANLFKGLAGVSNARGAHSGLTDEAEALFRLHLTTAAARYLIEKLP